MSFPFGGHPTLNDYLAEASRHGCKLTKTTIADEAERPCALYILEREGRHLLIADTALEERLAPTMVGQYDRRLGIQSKFATAPTGDDCD